MRFLFALVFAAIFSTASAQEQLTTKLEPGLWRTLIRTEQDGKPRPDKTENTCYSAAEFADPVATFLKVSGEFEKCPPGKHSLAGNTLSGTLICEIPIPTGGTLKIDVDITWVFREPKLITGKSQWTIRPPDRPPTIAKQTIAARHIGPCPN